MNWWECEPHRQIFGTGEIGGTGETGETGETGRTGERILNWAQAASLRQQGVIYHTNSEELRDENFEF
ncbi:hypothetical protein HMPREF9075_01585 [Capnocytophaga sp. oral taxon 332 str. F0381]|uniref:hypothetical protein n=1 Tax=Capnocytophaga sp. oral taxon 332 TaxID=712213 RepID=UPI0002A3E6D8|nr:hypothetical protein [Capnocytophaga sp. oral taxon 332]EKY08843.1 hypothetical protein HMPREF9075_01585 [Capnocytophaga sp. oral taxon 332 str. F0381]